MRSSSTCLTMIGAEILAEAAQKAEGRRGCEELTAHRSGLNAPVCAPATVSSRVPGRRRRPEWPRSCVGSHNRYVISASLFWAASRSRGSMVTTCLCRVGVPTAGTTMVVETRR